MNSITAEVVISSDHKLSLELDLPASCPTGAAVVTLIIEPKPQTTRRSNRTAEVRGLGKGKVWMSDDFDAPLVDFAEYM